MIHKQIPLQRLISQQLLNPIFSRPEDLVGWMGCMQAQDFASAKWAVGCRLKSCTEAQVESAFNEGRILRTHVLRPTWHLVSPADIRWMLQLSGPKINALCKAHHQRIGIDRRMLLRSKLAITRALENSHP